MTTTVGSIVEPWAPGGPPPGAGDAVAGRAPLRLFWERFREDRVATIALGFIVVEIFLAFFAPWVVKLLGHPPNALFPGQLDPAFGTPTGPSRSFLFGVDTVGRDVFSRVLYGGRISILAGLVATLLALGLGTMAGTIAGYYGGWADAILMRGGELLLALPWLYLLLAVRAVLPLHIPTTQAFLLVVGIIGSVGWIRPARLVRSVVLSTREHGYVLAAKGFGASGLYVIRRHILPQTLGVVVTQATVLIPQFILSEVTLSFLGLGISEPVPSWGNMLVEARQYHAIVQHPWLLAPGFAAIPVLLGYLFLADAMIERA